MLNLASPIKLASSPCCQLPGTKRQPKRGGCMTALPLALSFATRPSKPSRAAFSAPPPAGAGCKGSYWSGSARPTAAPIPAPWPGVTIGLSSQLLPARSRNELILCDFVREVNREIVQKAERYGLDFAL